MTRNYAPESIFSYTSSCREFMAKLILSNWKLVESVFNENHGHHDFFLFKSIMKSQSSTVRHTSQGLVYTS
jgi:hypothetical protein